MRIVWVLVALALFACLAGAQTPNGEADDATGDVVWETEVSDETPPLYETPSIDFERIWIGPDDADTVILGVDMAAPRPAQDPLFYNTVIDHAYITVVFRVGDVSYRVDLDQCRNVPGEARLSRSGPDGHGLAFVACLPVDEGDDGTYIIKLPRSELIDEDGLPIGATPLSDVAARSRQYAVGTAAIATDSVPDQGTMPDIPMSVDPWAFGPFRIATPSPVRSSNGGPDTIVYALHIRNSGPADHLVLHTESLPDGWTARVPTRVYVDEQTTIPMVVTIPSAHAHGTTKTFTLRAQSTRDDTVRGEVRYGVDFLAVPQLAGHHPDLFMHTIVDADRPLIGIPADAGWLNTLPEDPGAGQDPMPPTGGGGNGVQRRYHWGLPLDPALLIGMDFDTQGTGDLHAEFISDAPHLMATMTADLWHCDPNKTNGSSFNGNAWACRGAWFLLATGTSSQQDIASGQATAFDAELQPQEYADLVPYVPGSNIQLLLTLSATTPNPVVTPADAFLLPAAGRLHLPLHDYYDPIDVEWSAPGIVELRPTTAPVRAANPGQTVWSTFEIHALADTSLILDVAGLNAEWARWNTHEVSLARGDSKAVALRVDVPDDAVAGQTAELLLLAEPVDGAAGTVVKLVVKVVDESQAEDSAPAFVDGGRGTPGPGFAPLALALAALVLRRR